MEISEIKPNTIVHKLLHPNTGEEVGISFNLLPMTAPEVKSIVRQIQDQVNYLAARQKTMSAKDREEWTIKLNASAIAGWNWGEHTFEGVSPEFTKENVLRVLSKSEWIREQIDEALGEKKNFFAVSS